MVFSDTSNLTGIIQLCERYCNFPVAGISGVSNLLKEFTVYANEANREAWTIAHKNYGGWQYEDSNQNDLPIATATLTASQKNYGLPSTALTVKHLEVKNTDGNWTRLIPLTTEQISETGAISEFEETDGNPRYYSLMNDTITLYPAPDYTQAASLKVYYERGSHDFVYTDTTQTPGFASEFHGLIALGASRQYWFSKPQGNDAYQKLTVEYEKIKKNMGDYYSERWKEKFPPKVMVRDYLKENI